MCSVVLFFVFVVSVSLFALFRFPSVYVPCCCFTCSSLSLSISVCLVDLFVVAFVFVVVFVVVFAVCCWFCVGSFVVVVFCPLVF